ncbi:MAG: hypothetical protein C4530_03850 [Desulfobacteraceae bacterium]|nr:MAG: hypothetical protein C4530_03850 [Desulfobacteraceae bacterium]
MEAGRTVEQAVTEGRQAGLPAEALTYLPGMVFQATSAGRIQGCRLIDLQRQMMKPESSGHIVESD